MHNVFRCIMSSLTSNSVKIGDNSVDWKVGVPLKYFVKFLRLFVICLLAWGIVTFVKYLFGV